MPAIWWPRYVDGDTVNASSPAGRRLAASSWRGLLPWPPSMTASV
jgi:hypothetical protein